MADQQGVTLVEVLISLTILLIGILAVITMHITSMKNNKVAREMTTETHKASSDLERYIYENINDSTSKDYNGQDIDNTLQLYEFFVEVDHSGMSIREKIPYVKSEMGMTRKIRQQSE